MPTSAWQSLHALSTSNSQDVLLADSAPLLPLLDDALVPPAEEALVASEADISDQKVFACCKRLFIVSLPALVGRNFPDEGSVGERLGWLEDLVLAIDGHAPRKAKKKQRKRARW